MEKTKHTEEELKKQSLEILNLKPVESVSSFITRMNLSKIKKHDTFFFECDVNKAELKKLAFEDKVMRIEEVIEKKPLSDRNFYELARSAVNPYPMNDLGQGIGAATFEYGINQDHFTGRNLNPYIPGYLLNDNLVDIDNSGSIHSQRCFSCLYYAAPKASLCHVDNINFASDYSQATIYNREIRTASQSQFNSSDPDFYEYLLMDDYAYRWPFPVFCNPAGNEYGNIVQWANYNSINVGNVQHFNLSEYRHLPSIPVGSGTAWINPSAEWGGNDDRELPHLLAPGYHPDNGADYWIDMVLAPHNWGNGTSYSAPVANGMAACVMSADWRMLVWPEKVRVALMVTARNLHGGYWNQYEDGQDGNGVISGKSACEFAKNHTAVYPNNTEVETGLCADSWYSDQTEPKYFYVKIPAVVDNTKHLRIVLTWDSNPDALNG